MQRQTKIHVDVKECRYSSIQQRFHTQHKTHSCTHCLQNLVSKSTASSLHGHKKSSRADGDDMHTHADTRTYTNNAQPKQSKKTPYKQNISLTYTQACNTNNYINHHQQIHTYNKNQLALGYQIVSRKHYSRNTFLGSVTFNITHINKD